MQSAYNYGKLLGKFRELGLTQADVAARIGITEGTLNRKLASEAQFRQGEMQTIMELIDVPFGSVGEYFFTH